ncbi:MAG TPA: hypothetical protein VN973_06720 [Candidatus Dormibacteraeota bacterium]|jgi:hypothetical protein|nr:hypothetical protein [Candidatus Dormibacteraeota bacterium]
MSTAEVDRKTSASSLHTEFGFVLPRGYLDTSGILHREGVMRLATARDEILPQQDPRVRENDAYLTVLLLSRVVTRLGTITQVTPGTIEGLFASDLAFLQDLYRRINQEGHSQAAVTCPSCQHEFTVDMAGGRLGGS